MSSIDFTGLVSRGDVAPGHPDYEHWTDLLAHEDAIGEEVWVAIGCPPVEGHTISNADRKLLLDQPLTVRQAAIREHCSERTIHRWIKAGTLEVRRNGRAIRITRQALDKRALEASKPKAKGTATPRKHRARKKPQTAADSTSWFPA